MFSRRAWVNYLWWQEQSPAELRRVNTLINETVRNPFVGIGKPEPLKGDKYKGYWSRRITQEHRLVYRVSDSAENQILEIAQCQFHYDR